MGSLHDNHSPSRSPSPASLSGPFDDNHIVLESIPKEINESGSDLQHTDVPPSDSPPQSALESHGDEKGRISPIEPQLEVVEQQEISGTRKRWMAIVWMLTFWMPSPVIRRLVKTPRKDICEAWREKLAINMIIWFSCMMAVFFMIGFPMLICPRQMVFSYQELANFKGLWGGAAYVAIRGVVYDLGKLAPGHYPPVISSKDVLQYAGMDATNLFPVQVSALCNGISGSIDPAVQMTYRNKNFTDADIMVQTSDPNAVYHDFRWATNDSRPDWWWERQYTMQKNFEVGRIGFSADYLEALIAQQNYLAVLWGKVYDMSGYITGGPSPEYPPGVEPPSDLPDPNFMDPQVVALFQGSSRMDATKDWDALTLSSDEKARMKVCLDNLFYVGDVDRRDSARCYVAKYALLAVSIMLVGIICFKFLAALQFGNDKLPENLDRFVICQVPAYTEDEESLRRAIDSAARMKYNDKRKLLLIICDGVIIGEGNDRSTPQIVLEILGVGEDVDPEPLSFESLGEGLKQHNMGKVYTGLYQVKGHLVPFMVIVKVGRPEETNKPGNRGKRDSQMILMRFLSRIHYDLPMSPMELEMYHQIHNVIGVDPALYEFCMQIDADTVVKNDSATRMISSFIQDNRLIGVCGETALSNAKASMVTMIQVYEYYISHNLTKAFESLFGSVTCLPGCFSMYRIWTADKNKPLFVSKEVVEGYAVNRVDTLHMKNLLSLGEDRYLTTLLLKHHSKYKTKYIFTAHAWTVGPDSWKVFLSQRRRWINSTVHNLVELIPLQQLCGFCCFSMRFIVFIDLLSTVVQPVLMGYITYLLYLVVTDIDMVPITCVILLGAIYGLQAVIFIARRKWEMVGWMIVYIFATPVFSFALPLYAFWNMDDFSWGNTRVVVGDKGQKLVISDEGKFDPSSIPKRRWEDYCAEQWDPYQHGMGVADWDWKDDRSEVSAPGYSRSIISQQPPRTASRMTVGMGGRDIEHSLSINGSRVSLAPSILSAHKTDEVVPIAQLLRAKKKASRMMTMEDAAIEQDLNANGSRVSIAPSTFSALAGEEPVSVAQLLRQKKAVDAASVSGDKPEPPVDDDDENLPTDGQILRELREIMGTDGAMRLTKKNVRLELERRLGCRLDSKRDFISGAMEAILSGIV